MRLPELESLKLKLRAAGLYLVRRLGSPVRDARTGRLLGRALFVPFRGKLHVIGLEANVIPVFAPQERLTYWNQELAFTTHPPPDFPHEPGA